MAQYYQNDTLSRPAASVMVRHVVSAGEDSANSAAVTVNELTTIAEVLAVQIANGSNVRRAPQGAVTIAGNVVTIVDSGLAANEVITFEAVAIS